MMPTQAWLALIALATIFGGGWLVGAILTAVGRDLAPDDAGERRRGRVIGWLERALLLILISLGQWGAVGFVLAAKSVARFRELEDKRFSDYYLIGTLASLLVATVGGLAIRWHLGTLP